MKRVISLSAVLLVLVTAAAFSQTKDQNIRTLLTMTGSQKLAIDMMNAMIPQLEQIAPQVPPQLWKKIRENIDSKSFLEMLVPVYSKHYTNEEILELIAFYRTPLGQKVIKETPLIQQESIAVGRIWGERMAEQVIKELNKAGYKVS